MDTHVARELVAMRHESLAHSRHASGRGTVKNALLRAAMWTFGAAVVAPRSEPRHGRRSAPPECAPQA